MTTNYCKHCGELLVEGVCKNKWCSKYLIKVEDNQNEDENN